jgi:O-antigen/teichoic acid export membrane protein
VSKDSEAKNALVITVAENAALGVLGSIVFMLLRLGINVVIIRSLGAGSYGIYALAVSIITISGAIALLGIPYAMVKFVSQYKALNDIPRLKGTIWGGLALVLVSSTVLCLGLVYLSHFLNLRIFHKPDLTTVLKIMALSLPFSCLGAVVLASLQGAKLIKYRVLVNEVLVPLCRLSCIVLAIAVGYQLRGVAWAYAFAIVVGTVLGCFFLIKTFPEILKKGPIVYERRRLTSFSLPLLFIGIFQTLLLSQMSILMIGYYLSAAIVGIFATTQRFLPLILIPLRAFNNIFAPIISDLFAREKREELENQFKTVAKWVFMTSLPIFTLLIFFSKQLLSIFGPEFAAHSGAMIVLCTGQMINSATGSGGLMLMMTGRPYINLFNSALLCVASILLNIYMIPRYGIIGAAGANAFSISAIQLLQLLEVWYLLGMHPYHLDFLKPILSCLFSVLLLTVISHIGLNTNSLIIIPVLSAIFLLSYGGFLWLFKLSPEDYVILDNLRYRLLKQKGPQIEHAA